MTSVGLGGSAPLGARNGHDVYGNEGEYGTCDARGAASSDEDLLSHNFYSGPWISFGLHLPLASTCSHLTIFPLSSSIAVTSLIPVGYTDLVERKSRTLHQIDFQPLIPFKSDLLNLHDSRIVRLSESQAPKQLIYSRLRLCQ
jgi:hypothetical protein